MIRFREDRRIGRGVCNHVHITWGNGSSRWECIPVLVFAGHVGRVAHVREGVTVQAHHISGGVVDLQELVVAGTLSVAAEEQTQLSTFASVVAAVGQLSGSYVLTRAVVHVGRVVVVASRVVGATWGASLAEVVAHGVEHNALTRHLDHTVNVLAWTRGAGLRTVEHFCNAPVAVAQELILLRAVGWELQGDGVNAIAVVVVHRVRAVVPAVKRAGNGHVVEAFVAHVHRERHVHNLLRADGAASEDVVGA